jgi:transcriptional regulator with XRE-family HTH domain
MTMSEPRPGPARDLVALFQELRFTAQRTNGQIALSTGLSRSHVSEVLRGRKAPSPDTAARIAQALGATAHIVQGARLLAEQLGEWNQYERSTVRKDEKRADPSTVTSDAGHPSMSLRIEGFGRFVDPYVRRARLEPVLTVLLPPCLLGVVLVPPSPVWLAVLAMLAFGLPVVVDHVARERGRRLEPTLFGRWGGKPTTQLLRWSGPLGHQHQALVRVHLREMIGPRPILASEADEQADPAATDEAYDAAVMVLRVLVRRAENNRGLVFEENCQYGFRRNSLGLRPIGIALSLLTLIGAGIDLALPRGSGAPAIALVPVMVVSVVSAMFLWFWIFVVRPRWVELAAWRYAHRLIESAARASSR